MATKLTKRAADAAQPGETVWDTELKGFALRVTKRGAKSFILRYRVDGAQRLYTIGRYGSPWTADAARKEALRLLGLIQSGADPTQERAERRSSQSFQEFSTRYVDEYATVHKKPSTTREEQRALKNHILPALGRKRLTDIKRADIAKFHRSLSETPYAANRYLALLSHMFAIASDWGLRGEEPNPCLRVKRFPEEARERFLSSEELKRLGEALKSAQARGESIYVVSAIRLLLFTGARLNEILRLKWEHIDLEARLLRLPESKTGKKTIALPAPALEVLQNIPQQEGNPYVIGGKIAGSHLVNLQKPWRRIRAQAGLEDVRLHDLRHSFASVAAAGGMSLPLIGSMLGHTQAQTTQRYAHFSEDPRIAAADTVAEKIAANMEGDNAEIIPLKTNR